MRKFLASHLTGSIWLATITVILLVILLALTVNHAREKALVQQFSRQKAAIASGIAAGIEDHLNSIEKSLVMLTKLPALRGAGGGDPVHHIRDVYDDLEGRVMFIALMDDHGVIRHGHPQERVNHMINRPFGDNSFFRAVREAERTIIVRRRGDAGDSRTSPASIPPSIVIGAPVEDDQGHHLGAVIAVLSMDALAGRYLKPVEKTSSSRSWLLDADGTFLIHSDPGLTADSLAALRSMPVTDERPLDEIVHEGGSGHGQYTITRNGKVIREVIAYAPLRAGRNCWTFAVVTAHDSIITLARTAYVNMMFGSGALIVIVAITGISLARASTRRLRMKEEMKRLKEREDWQWKLLREKKTAEGIIEGSPVAMFVINKDHQILYWNKACAELTGWDAASMIGTGNHGMCFYGEKRPLIADIIVDDDVNVLEKYYGTKQVRESRTIEGAYEARDFFNNMGGKERHLFFMAAPIYDEKGEIAAAIETIQDVTTEVNMAESLKEHAESIQREKRTVEGIIEGSPVPTFVVDRNHHIILWNRACAELTGYDATVMVGTDSQYKPFYPEKRPVIADFIIDRDIEGLEQYYGMKQIKKSDTVKGAYEARDFFAGLGGKDRHLYFLAAPIYDEKGDIIAAIETLQDISRETAMARDLRDYAESLQNELGENIKLRKEIEELYNYLQSIIESLPDKIYDLTSDGIIDYASKGLGREREAPSVKIKGTHFTELVAPENMEYVLSKWEDAKKGIFKPYELEVTARDGSRRNLHITPRPVKGTGRYVLVQRDITELKNLEKKYYESQKLAALGQLSAGIAHEVRNPLSSIKMSLQILEKRMNPGGNDLKRFKIAEKEVEHLEKLVNDVLFYARPSEPRKKLTDVRDALEDALAMVEKAIADKHITVQRRLDGDIPPLMADSAMMGQAFLNIYLNAIDAMDDGGKLLVSAGVIDSGRSSVVIEIEDNGCGIEKEDMPHLFNPFFTKKQYGTGLGLAQVKKIIDLHQGTIEVLSKKGEGTRFIVTLPVAIVGESTGGAA